MMQTPPDSVEEQPTQYYRRPAAETAPPPPVARPAPLWIAPPPAPPRRTFSWQRAFFASLLLLAALLLAAFIGGGVWLYTGDGIAPGARVLGVDIGGRSVTTAGSTLQAAWNQRAIALTYETDNWLLHPQDLGVTLDVPATIAAAYSASRQPASWQGWLQTGRIDVQPVWQLDPAQTAVALERIAPQLALPAQDASLLVQNGQVQTQPAREGRALDVPATVGYFVSNGAAAVLNGQLPLQMKSVPPQVTDVSAAAATAATLLQNSIQVRAYDPVRDEAFTWVMNPAVWGDWLQLQSAAPGASFSWRIDREGAAAFFAARAGALGTGRYLDLEAAVDQTVAAITDGSSAVELRIYHGTATHIVQPGETLSSIGRAYGIPYPWIQQANPGLPATLSIGEQIVIPSPDDLLPYPIVDQKRIIVSISEQRVWAYENGALKWDWRASTGIASSPTAPGVFQVQTHEQEAYAANWDLWMPNFMGIYQPVPTSDFMNGFHGFPTRDGVNLLWTGNLGQPVTYGCILLGNQEAAQLYNWAEQGVIVEIRP